MGHIIICEEFTRMGLSPSEMMILGLIHGFSQGRQGVFYGSRTYMAKWLGCTLPTIDKTLRKLTGMGLIEKGECYEGGVRRCTYVSLVKEGERDFTGKEILLPPERNFTDTGKEILPNSKEDNKDIKLLPPVKPPKSEIVLPYGSEEFGRTWRELTRQPKWRGKTPTALAKCAEWLGKYPEQTAIGIMNTTIMNGWQGLFEPKETGGRGQARTSNLVETMKASRESFRRIADRRGAGEIDNHYDGGGRQ